MVKEPTGPPDDSEPEAHALDIAIDPVKFLKNLFLLFIRNADAGIKYFNQQMIAAPPRADQHLAFFGIGDGIGEQILDDPAQIGGIGDDGATFARHPQFQPLALREGAKFTDHRVKNPGNREADAINPGLPVQFRDIEKIPQDRLDRTKGALNPFRRADLIRIEISARQ